MSENYFFDKSKDDNTYEWMGSHIGVSNIITNLKSNTDLFDSDIDSKEGLYREFMRSAKRIMADPELFIHDAVIYGIRVRITTNSRHISDFWKVNWYNVNEWKKAAGIDAPRDPAINVFSFIGLKDQGPGVYYSDSNRAVFAFNTSYYGQLKSVVLGVVGKLLQEKYGIHSVHGAVVEAFGRGALIIAPSGAGKSTTSYGISEAGGGRLLSDDWTYIRYCYKHKSSGRFLAIYSVSFGDEIVSGSDAHKWIRQNSNKSFRCGCISENWEELELDSQEFDFNSKVSPVAFRSEKTSYLRTDIVRSFPSYMGPILKSRLENVPQISSEFFKREGESISRLLNKNDSIRMNLGIHEERLREFMLRLCCFDNSRAMVGTGSLTRDGDRIPNPLEPVFIDAVILLKKDPDDDVVARSLGTSELCSELIKGKGVDGKGEIAFNRYRIVDTEKEHLLIENLADEMKRIPSARNIYDVYERLLSDNPSAVTDSMRSEFELFKALGDSARCYEVNTILTRKYHDKFEAIRKTITLVSELVKRLPPDVNIGVREV